MANSPFSKQADPKPEKQAEPASRQATPETRQPRFLASVAAARAPELARFDRREKLPLLPLDQPPARQGVVDLRDIPPLVEKRSAGPTAIHGPAASGAARAAFSPLHEVPYPHGAERGHPEGPPAGPPFPREVERLSQAIETLRLQGERLAEQARADALEIAFQIAQRIIESELRTNPEPLFALVRSALKQAGEAHRVKVHVHPADAEILRGPRGGEASLGLSIASIEIVADPSLGRGDAVVDTDFGHVDGRLATRFQELRRALSAAGDAA